MNGIGIRPIAIFSANHPEARTGFGGASAKPARREVGARADSD